MDSITKQEVTKAVESIFHGVEELEDVLVNNEYLNKSHKDILRNFCRYFNSDIKYMSQTLGLKDITDKFSDKKIWCSNEEGN